MSLASSVPGGAGHGSHLVIQRLLDGQGFDAPLHSSGVLHGDDACGQIATVERLLRQQPRAIVCETLSLHNDVRSELQWFQDRGGLVVCYDVPTKLNCDQVIFDRADNTFQTTRHVLQLGHRDIGLYVMGPAGARANYATPSVEGFESALYGYGLKSRAEWTQLVTNLGWADTRRAQ